MSKKKHYKNLDTTWRGHTSNALKIQKKLDKRKKALAAVVHMPEKQSNV